METLSIGKVSASDTGGMPPPPAGRTFDDFDRLGERELLDILRAQPRTSELWAAACEVLVRRHHNLVRSCVHRYRRTPEMTDDLMQVGYVGLLKAINNFDPAVGRSLAAYAQPCIVGELKRHFRDKSWHAHVERSVQELVLEVREATTQLTHRLGHEPAEADVAAYLGASDDVLRDARRAEMALQPWSLDAPLTDRPGAASLADVLGDDDPRVEHALDMQAVASHWGELPKREQRILLMRFYGDMTQAEIGKQLGISQMQVSRLLARSLAYLRQRLLDVNDPRPAAGLAATA
ncbi:MAG TPA: sigma-70 family RNA polymerase sigma factor [Streptosporangiaceae bacterium]|jgi:RNA polymerase sigma-B factor|nr:sigma-70 family RNA polymerase sigma factor [Streptosporangiaceae bacterium]